MDSLGQKFREMVSWSDQQKQEEEEGAAVKAAREKVQAIIEAGEPWTDPDFPPTQDSLYAPGEKPVARDYEWKRASEIYGDKLKVIDHEVDPNDVNQGELGNCYFLATVSACAEEPKRIRDRVLIKQVNSAGVYLVTMFVNGVITPVILDDWFPTVYGKAAFCSSTNGEIWAMLFEKAWAKLYGSYGRTSGGLCCHAAEHMTGLPTKSFEHKEVKDKDAFFKKMLKFDKDHLTILAGSAGGDDTKLVDGIA